MTVQFVSAVLTLLVLSFITGESGKTIRGSLGLMLGLLDSCSVSRTTGVTAVQPDEDTVVVGEKL